MVTYVSKCLHMNKDHIPGGIFLLLRIIEDEQSRFKLNFKNGLYMLKRNDNDKLKKLHGS